VVSERKNSSINFKTMSFNNFWRWLCKKQRVIQNLGGRKYKGKPRAFTIKADKYGGTCVPKSTNKKHSFTQEKAEKVWEHFWYLQKKGEHLMAGRYVDGKKLHNWNQCPKPRYCNPWIAAAIRDFSKRS
jgi:hypothetical protein